MFDQRVFDFHDLHECSPGIVLSEKKIAGLYRLFSATPYVIGQYNALLPPGLRISEKAVLCKGGVRWDSQTFACAGRITPLYFNHQPQLAWGFRSDRQDLSQLQRRRCRY
ncbi:hypothetical protein CUN67_14900 [Pantoea cypripedii]|uniref:Uncharacterized protein n=1 Tax=Pantoea cypripedii TaxID=55209 RepID=A0A6B9G3Y8_PANCY|nr:hypothetical protein CUN67_14900 [Pantoea cypripedii]